MATPAEKVVFANDPRALLKIEKFQSVEEHRKIVSQIKLVDLTFQIVFKSSVFEEVCKDWRTKDSSYDILALRLRSERYDGFDPDTKRKLYSIELSVHLASEVDVIEKVSENLDIWDDIPDVIEYCSRLLLAAKRKNITLVTPNSLEDLEAFFVKR